MATSRKRKKPQTDLTPKQVNGKEADRVKGGNAMLSKLIQAKNDMQKALISNFRV